MASKFMTRVLNRSIENINSYSFSQYNEEYDSFATFHFDNEEKVKNDAENIHVLKNTDLVTEKIDNSFSKMSTDFFEHFEMEGKYLGRITDINTSKKIFSANVVGTDDLISRDIVFSIDDIPSEEAKNIEVGRRIIYVYGKQYRNGTATNISKLYFRDASNWTRGEIDRKRKEAEELYNILNENVKETDG